MNSTRGAFLFCLSLLGQFTLALKFFFSSIWLIVTKKRLEQKRFVSFEANHPLWELIEDSEFLEFKKTYSFFTTDILGGDDILLDEYIWGYICCLYCVVYNDETINKENHDYVYSRETPKEIENSIRKYVHEAIKNIGFEAHSLELIYLVSFF